MAGWLVMGKEQFERKNEWQMLKFANIMGLVLSVNCKGFTSSLAITAAQRLTVL